jgi:hypothetical protein
LLAATEWNSYVRQMYTPGGGLQIAGSLSDPEPRRSTGCGNVFDAAG